MMTLRSPDALPTTGKWIVGLFSLGVLDLGVAEWLGLRALRGRVEPAVVWPESG